MAINDNSIAVKVLADSSKAEITLNQFQQTLLSFTSNYSQTTNNILQLSENATNSFTNLSTSIANVGFIFSHVNSVVSSVASSYMSFTDTLSKMSQRTGISAEALGGLKFAAEQCGGDARSKVNKIQEPFSLTAGLGKTQNCTLPTFRTAESRNNESTRLKNSNGLLTILCTV